MAARRPLPPGAPGAPPSVLLLHAALALLLLALSHGVQAAAPTSCAEGCEEHGTCNLELGRCDCPPDRAGIACSNLAKNKVEDDFCINGCNGRGECKRGYCKCRPGAFGADCALELDPASGRPVLAGPGDEPYEKQMARPFIYVYELPPELMTLPGYHSLDRPLMMSILERLTSSQHRVADPSVADYFFIPWDPRSLPKIWPDVLRYIRTTWPHWDRLHGKDHLLANSGDWGACELVANGLAQCGPPCHVVNELSNATWITHWGIRHPDLIFKNTSPCHVAGKDIVVPAKNLAGGGAPMPRFRQFSPYWVAPEKRGELPAPAALGKRARWRPRTRRGAGDLLRRTKEKKAARPEQGPGAEVRPIPGKAEGAPPAQERRGSLIRLSARSGGQWPRRMGGERGRPARKRSAAGRALLAEGGPVSGGATGRGARWEKANRTILLSFAGSASLPWVSAKDYSRGVREKIFNMHKGVQGFSLHQPSVPNVDELMARSVFCLAPAGSGFGIRFVFNIVFGCIPVVVQDDISQAWEEQLPIDKISIRVAESDVDRLPEILRAIPPAQVESMQEELSCAWPHFLWSSVFGSYMGEDGSRDAFATLMATLLARKERGTDRILTGSFCGEDSKLKGAVLQLEGAELCDFPCHSLAAGRGERYNPFRAGGAVCEGGRKCAG